MPSPSRRLVLGSDHAPSHGRASLALSKLEQPYRLVSCRSNGRGEREFVESYFNFKARCIDGISRTDGSSIHSSRLERTDRNWRMRDMELGPRSSQLTSRVTSPSQDRWFTLLLASVASIACLQVRIEPSQWKSWLLSEWICVLIVAGILRWLCLRGPHHATTWYRTGLAGLAIMAPWISQVVQWSLQWPYEANELVWMNLFQNATLILAALAHSSRQSWTSLLMACFSTLFCLATSDRMEILITASIFGILVMWWLMVRHWEQLDPGLTATDAIPLFRLRVSAVILILMLAGSAAILAHRSGIEAYALQGFMPTSGGNQGADESARSGVGDGSMLVAAKDNATTFGPVESDLFLESQLPTLYDLATDVSVNLQPRSRRCNKPSRSKRQSKRPRRTLENPNHLAKSFLRSEAN